MNLKVGQLIFEELKKIYDKTYFYEAPRGTVFPYVVYRTPTTFQTESELKNIMLEVRVYDNEWNNITILETMTENINKSLHKKICFDDDSFIMFYLESILQIDNVEERTRQRMLRFRIEYSDREV